MLPVNNFLTTRALKKNERLKRLKQNYEKIKKAIKEKYRFCNLYIKNLPDNFDDENLRELFAKFGKIRSVKTVRKELYQSYLGIKRSVKVCGFVCFQDAQSAKEAKNTLNMTNQFHNPSKLYVDYHQNKIDRAEILKLKQIHQLYSKGANKNQEIQNHQMVIKQMQMGGRKLVFINHLVKPQFNTPFGPHMLRKFPPQTGFTKPPQFAQGGMPQQQMSMNPQMMQQVPVQQQGINMVQADLTKMDPNMKREYVGEHLFHKISSNPQYSSIQE